MRKYNSIHQTKKAAEKRLQCILLTLLLVLAVLLGTTTLISASDVSDAEYRGRIEVSNNSTSASNVFTILDLNTQSLIDTGKLNATATDAAIQAASGTDVAFMPGANATYPWVIYVPLIGEDETLYQYLYTGNATGGKLRYFPGTGGMTTPDSASLELSDNFTIEQKGWGDTDNGTDKNLVNKQGAFRVFVSPTVSGNITADFGGDLSLQQDTQDAENLLGANYKDRAGQKFISFNYSEITSVQFYLLKTGLPTGTLTVNVRNVTGDAVIGVLGTLDVATLGAGYAWKTFNTPVSTTFGSDIYILAEYSGGDGSNYVKCGIDDSDTVAGIHTYYDSGAYTDVGGSDSTMKLEAISKVRVTATGVSSGELTIKTDARGESDTWAAGAVLLFNNTTNSEIIINGDSYNGTAKMWVSFWFKLDDNFSSASPRSMFLFTKRIDTNNYIRAHLENTGGRLYFQLRTSAVDRFTLPSPAESWDANQWYHVLLSISDVNAARLRIDNGTVQTNPDTNAAPDGGDFRVGKAEWANFGLEGVIANLIMGTDDLTPTEETALYNGTAPGDETDYWYIDEGTGTTIGSYGSENNAGTAGANTTWTTSTYTGSNYTGRLCDFILSINDTTQRRGTNLKGVSVPDNSNDWTFLENNVLPYMEYQAISVNGTQVQYIDWEYTTGNFTDSSGYGNDATPTFRTTSSDPDVSAELISFLGIMTATPPSAAGQEGWNIMTSVPDAPAGFFTELNMSFWGAGYIQEFSDATDIPLPLIVFPYAFGIAIGLGGLAWYISSGGGKNKHGRGSLLAMAITTLIVLIYFVYGGGGVIPAWILLPFGIEVLVLIVWRQTPSPF